MTAGPHVSRLADFEALLDQVVEEHREHFPEVHPGVNIRVF